ncbi:hypothetical protein PQR15_10920 [Streptomyces lydicus]|nr:hypothetical protein [Streptomyces lydicus]
MHVLREALARVAPHDPDLGSHRLLFGRALRLRHERQPSLADLHEADWVLELAARGADVPDVVCAEAWLEVGDVQLLLDRRFDSRSATTGPPPATAGPPRPPAGPAAPCWPPAPTTAAPRSWRSPPARAPRCTPTARLGRWQRAGEDAGPEAQRTRARMRALESTA